MIGLCIRALWIAVLVFSFGGDLLANQSDPCPPAADPLEQNGERKNGQTGSDGALWENAEELKAKKGKPDGSYAETISKANCAIGLVLHCVGDPPLSHPDYGRKNGDDLPNPKKDFGKSGIADLKGKPKSKDGSAVNKAEKFAEPSDDADEPDLGRYYVNSGLHKKTEWSSFPDFVASACIVVAGNCSEGPQLKSRGAETWKDDKLICVGKQMVDKAAGALADHPSPQAMFDFIQLAALLFHEGVHMGQEHLNDPKVGEESLDKEKAAYRAQRKFAEFLLEWFCGIENDECEIQSQEEQELYDSIKDAYKGSDAKEELEKVVESLKALEEEQASQFTAALMNSVRSLPISGGKLAVVRDDGATGCTFSLEKWGDHLNPIVQLNLPLESVYWVSYGSSIGDVLIAGQAGEVQRIVLVWDSDLDGFPDMVSFYLDLASSVNVDVADVRRAWDYQSDKLCLLLLDSSAGKLTAMLDTNGDGVPESVVATPFVESAGLVGARIHDVKKNSAGWDVRFVTASAPQEGELWYGATAVDGDGDWVAESLIYAPVMALDPGEGRPEFLDELPEWALPMGANGASAPANLSGSSIVYASTDRFPNGSIEVRDLSAGGELLGALVVPENQLEVGIPISRPLVAGQLIELRNTISGLGTHLFVTDDRVFGDQSPQEVDPGIAVNLIDGYDFDANGVNDFWSIVDVPSKEFALYVGLRDGHGHVSSMEAVVLPDCVTGMVMPEESTDVECEFPLSDWYSFTANADRSKLFRLAGAPGFGMAWLPGDSGDVNGDGLFPDALIILREFGTGSQVLHVGLLQAGGSLGWQSQSISADKKIVSYSSEDHDGDGDVDVLLEVVSAAGGGSGIEEVLLLWEESAFAPIDGPLLTVYGAEVDASRPVSVPYFLSVTCGQGLCGQSYILGLSFTGTSPPMVIDGVSIPLVQDALTDWALGMGNSDITSGFFGTLDGEGAAYALLTPPEGTYSIGMQVFAAFAVIDTASGNVIDSSNPVQFVIH